MQIKLNFSLRENVEVKKINHKKSEPPDNIGQTKTNPMQKELLKRSGQFINKSQASSNWKNINPLMEDLNQLIGLSNVKTLIKEIVAYVEIQKCRAKENLLTDPLTLHMIFKGNPGTGKTTVARIIGKLLKELGVLSKGHIIEVERADLVGEYIGHTAQKTRDQLKKAAGGVLFIDEAYSLARGGEKDFGKEAIDVLVKAMEDHRNDLIVILAGYTSEMDWFIKSNPGLKSRFAIQINFSDYTVLELVEIAKLMLKKREYFLSIDAEQELEKILRRALLQGHVATGNARFVRNLIEQAIRRQALRLVEIPQLSREQLLIIDKPDLQEHNDDHTREYDHLCSVTVQ